MTEPTWASVTQTPCSCLYLQNEANEKGSAITFDERTNEYSVQCGDRALIIYHCPFCGGTAPKSKREELFERIPFEENERFEAILKGLTTINAVIRKLGAPDHDGYSQRFYAETDATGPKMTSHREVRYEQLSRYAYLFVTQEPENTISWYLQGRPKSAFSWDTVPRHLRPGYLPWWKKLIASAIGLSHRTT